MLFSFSDTATDKFVGKHFLSISASLSVHRVRRTCQESVEVDLMGDAAMARNLEGEERRANVSRSDRRRFAKKKKTVGERTTAGKVVTVRFPKFPGADVGDDVKQVTCMLVETGKQRPRGVWVRREDFPWHVTLAAMEVANADGEDFFPPSPPAVNREEPTYSIGTGAWDLTWTDPSTQVLHLLTKTVPRRRYGRGGVIIVIPPHEFLEAKERARRQLLAEARARGFQAHDDQRRPPETA